jgi:hypothetical protein
MRSRKWVSPPVVAESTMLGRDEPWG